MPLLIVSNRLLFTTKQKDWEYGFCDDSIWPLFHLAKRRLILLDYDGTLAPFNSHPLQAAPAPEVLAELSELAKDERNKLVLVSGRDKTISDRWFGRVIGLSLVAEHGVWIKESEEWELIKPLQSDWKEQIMPILKLNTDRLPGSFIEEKEYSIAWHYRSADLELAELRVKELADNLVNLIANQDIQVIHGNRVLEVRNAGADKGAAALYFLAKDDFDFILAIGDDRTDEDMFAALPESAYTIKVGFGPSLARYRANGVGEILELLRKMGKVGMKKISN